MNQDTILAAAAILLLIPMLAAGIFPGSTKTLARVLPVWARIGGPALLSIPYALVALSFGSFHWGWLALYLLLPVAIAWLMNDARHSDSAERGDWRDYLVLAALGLAVDLRWFEPAWPAGLAAMGKMLLVDAGIFGFLVVRQLDGVGFDLRIRWPDVGVGLRELCFYSVIAIPLGLGLGFLHWHRLWPSPLRFGGAFLFTFFLIAIPEELFFRGWMQNLLERRMGRIAALAVTSVLFGLAHWNKQTVTFNWRYVLLAAVAGVFYGRAWRSQRRVVASALTHSTVDTLWSIWLR